MEIWGGELSGDRYVVIFFNRGDMAAEIKLDLTRPEFLGKRVKAIRDVIQHKDVEVPKTTTLTSKKLKVHDVDVYVLELEPKSKSLESE